jgi:HPr kinase/phosphorylase
MSVHGVLLDVHGVGVLLLGPSGIGKSECALELIARGHTLVADDVVELRREKSGPEGENRDDPVLEPELEPVLYGRAHERIRHYMDIRGLGIIYIPDLFGPGAVREEMRIDLLCRLRDWAEGGEYERIGLERQTEELEGVRLPRLILPARPGGNMATIVDVAAREHRQRTAGESAASRLDAQLQNEMRRS